MILKNNVIERSCDFIGGSPLWYVTTHRIVVVEIRTAERKKTNAIPSRNSDKKEKEKKTRSGIAKMFALHTDIINILLYVI